jgi:broad specificity phosphatase PhoE
LGKIYLARHGQDQDNAAGLLNGRRNTPLTPKGLQQAEELAKKVAGLQIDYIYTSPLIRAVQTGHACWKELGLPGDRLIIHQDLIERDFGVLTGRPKTDIPKLGRNILETDHTTYFLEAEGAEDFPAVYRRAERVLEQILAQHPEDNVLITCHGDVGNMVRAAYYCIEWIDALVNHGRFMNCDVFELSPVTRGGCLITR